MALQNFTLHWERRKITDTNYLRSYLPVDTNTQTSPTPSTQSSVTPISLEVVGIIGGVALVVVIIVAIIVVGRRKHQQSIPKELSRF